MDLLDEEKSIRTLAVAVEHLLSFLHCSPVAVNQHKVGILLQGGIVVPIEILILYFVILLITVIFLFLLFLITAALLSCSQVINLFLLIFLLLQGRSSHIIYIWAALSSSLGLLLLLVRQSYFNNYRFLYRLIFEIATGCIDEMSPMKSELAMVLMNVPEDMQLRLNPMDCLDQLLTTDVTRLKGLI